MYTLLICLGIGIIGGIIFGMKIKGRFEHYFIGTLVGFLISCLLIVIIASILPKYECEERHNIIAANDGKSLNCKLFLGTGAIKETTYYFYYEKDHNGAITQHKVETKITTIYEDAPDNLSAYIEFHKFLIIEPYNKWIFREECECNTSFDYAEIHTPKGSVIRQFKLDLE